MDRNLLNSELPTQNSQLRRRRRQTLQNPFGVFIRDGLSVNLGIECFHLAYHVPVPEELGVKDLGHVYGQQDAFAAGILLGEDPVWDEIEIVGFYRFE